jgi:hypothetical protein
MAKHAFLLLSSPDNPGKFANPLTYAQQLDAAGHDVVVYFDGAATNFFDGLADRAPPAVEAYEGAKDSGLIAGVCDHCATVMDVVDALKPKDSTSPVQPTNRTPLHLLTTAMNFI